MVLLWRMLLMLWATYWMTNGNSLIRRRKLAAGNHEE